MRTPDHVLRKRIAELQVEQVLRNGPTDLLVELDEIPAIQKLAHDVFGDLTSISVDRDLPGVFQVGYFTGPAPKGTRGDGMRPRAVVFRARTARELGEQIATWKANR